VDDYNLKELIKLFDPLNKINKLNKFILEVIKQNYKEFKFLNNA